MTNEANSTGGSDTPLPGLVNSGLPPGGRIPSPYRDGFETKISERLDGLQKHLPSGTSLALNGQVLDQAALVRAFQAVADLFTAHRDAIKQGTADVGRARLALAAQLPAALQFLSGLDHALIAFFGKGHPILDNFGVASGARKNKPSSATQAAAAASALLTRRARHTMGKRQRLQIEGGKATLVTLGPDGERLPDGGGGPAPGE